MPDNLELEKSVAGRFAILMFIYCWMPPISVPIVAQKIQDPDLTIFTLDGVWNEDAVWNAELNILLGYLIVGGITLFYPYSCSCMSEKSIARLTGINASAIAIGVLFSFINGLETFIGSRLRDQNFDQALENAKYSTAAAFINSLIFLGTLASMCLLIALGDYIENCLGAHNKPQSAAIKQPLLTAFTSQATPSEAVMTLRQIANTVESQQAGQATNEADSQQAGQRTNQTAASRLVA